MYDFDILKVTLFGIVPFLNVTLLVSISRRFRQVCCEIIKLCCNMSMASNVWTTAMILRGVS